MGVFALVAIGVIALILNQPPLSKVVLLPDADGKAGAITIKTSAGEQLLSTAFGSASVDRQGGISSASEDPTKVSQQYASTLSARPTAPVSFTVYFEFGSALDISPVIQPVLEQLGAALASYPGAQITVIGHTDRVGSLESNDVLSLQRAETVLTLILQAGIQASMLEVAGRGEREPIVPTADEVAEPKNRRVEINLR